MASTCPYGDQKDLHFGIGEINPKQDALEKDSLFNYGLFWVSVLQLISSRRVFALDTVPFGSIPTIDSCSRRQVTRNRFYLEYPPTSINQSMTTCMNQVRS